MLITSSHWTRLFSVKMVKQMDVLSTLVLIHTSRQCCYSEQKCNIFSQFLQNSSLQWNLYNVFSRGIIQSVYEVHSWYDVISDITACSIGLPKNWQWCTTASVWVYGRCEASTDLLTYTYTSLPILPKKLISMWKGPKQQTMFNFSDWTITIALSHSYWLLIFVFTSIITSMARNSLLCADVPLRNDSLTHSSAASVTSCDPKLSLLQTAP